MSKNSVFQQINELINISLRSYRIRSIAYKQTSSNTVNEHFSIVEAINQSDGKLAKKAMRDHLKVSKSEIETIINWE